MTKDYPKKKNYHDFSLETVAQAFILKGLVP